MSTTTGIGIAAIFKNEAPYVVEWLAHHRLLGVDRFFIADHGSTDGTSDILRQLAAAGILSWRPWSDQPEVNPQISAYRSLLAEFGDQVDWMAFLDADEYIWAQSAESLCDFLGGMPSDVGAVALNWATYGSSDRYFHTDDPTPARFIWHADATRSVNRNFKTVARPRSIRDFTCPHNVILDPASRHVHTDGTTKRSAPSDGRMGGKYAHCQSDAICWERFRVNHYIIRSLEEYATKKSRRGRAYSPSGLDDLYFWGHDFHDKASAGSEAYLRDLRAEMEVLNALLSTEVRMSALATFGGDEIPPAPMLGHIDAVSVSNGILSIEGWALVWTRHPVDAWTVSVNGTVRVASSIPLPIPRADVRLHHHGAAEQCGFRVTIPHDAAETVHSVTIEPATAFPGRFQPLQWMANKP